MPADDIKIRTNRAKVATQLQPNWLLRKTIRQLNYIGIFNLAIIKAVYNQRLEALRRPEQREAA